MGDNVCDKAIVYSSSVKAIKGLAEGIDNHMNYPNTIDGDTILIIGDLESDWKFVLAAEFTIARNDFTAVQSLTYYYRRTIIFMN